MKKNITLLAILLLVLACNEQVERMEIKLNEFEAYDLATTYSEELLNNGMANYLEVLTARENALNSQLELINTELDKFIAIIDLYQALGGGWQ